MIKYKSILFDLDGTLTASGLGITKGVQYALRKFNIEENDLKALEQFIGPPLTDSFMEYYKFSKEDADKGLEYYREYYSEIGIFENELYPGIISLLQELQKIKFKLYIATSKPTAYAKKICEYFDIAKYFIDIQGSDINANLSKKAEIIEQVITKHKLNKLQTLMVGDREHDVIGAKNNGIDCAGIGHGYGSKEELVNSGAACYVRDAVELFELLVNKKDT